MMEIIAIFGAMMISFFCGIAVCVTCKSCHKRHEPMKKEDDPKN